MIIGLTGKNAAGKGEVAGFLQDKGFYVYSLSDVLREELKTRGEEPTRENLVRIGRELRGENGDGYLAERVLARTQPDKNYVVDSFRHPAEIAVFRRDPRYRLLLIEANPKIRFERIRQRGREADPATLNEFLQLEEKEHASAAVGGQQLHLSAEQADQIVPLVDHVLTSPEAHDALTAWVTRYFGDTTPGAATARFHAAVDHLMDEWNRWDRQDDEDHDGEEAELDA